MGVDRQAAGVERVSAPDAPLDLGSVRAAKAMEHLRLAATESTVLAGAYATRGLRTAAALRAGLDRLAADYDAAYAGHARAVPAPRGAPAEPDWRDLLLGVGLGAGAGLIAEATVPAGVAAGWHILAEVAESAAGSGAPVGRDPGGNPAPPGPPTPGPPTRGRAPGPPTPGPPPPGPPPPGPPPAGPAVGRQLSAFHHACLAVRRHVDYLPALLAGAEYVLTQFRRLDTGDPAELPRPAAVGLAATLEQAAGQLGRLNAELRARHDALHRLEFQASAPGPTRLGVERQIWIMWLSERGDDPGALAAAGRRLREIGADGVDLATARQRADAIRARYAALVAG